jgi:hypothetical protein
MVIHCVIVVKHNVGSRRGGTYLFDLSNLLMVQMELTLIGVLWN